ncbi:DUF6428 family protein [Mucilaginibacter segetis]|nr:DUF6428 family protein [Mucilaginibacter segetis]
MEDLTWGQFKALLLAHPNLHLQFKYAEDALVDASYHITEIKKAPITSVDCGGVINNWTEIIIQLWEPQGKMGGDAMKVEKALSIINLVEKALTLDAEANVKIEFGNSTFYTRQMYPSAIAVHGNDLIVDLRPDVTRCKAINRGGSCVTADKGEECCTPVKPKVQLIDLAQTNCCEPGSGCC